MRNMKLSCRSLVAVMEFTCHLLRRIIRVDAGMVADWTGYRGFLKQTDISDLTSIAGSGFYRQVHRAKRGPEAFPT
jgi:hypothetical protein